MSYLYACRICLRTDGKLYDYNCFKLKLFYEELMGIEVDNSDYLPHYFCVECATMLHKFHNFKEKCNTGQNTLEALMWGNTLHLKSIEDVDRKSKNLLSPLSRIFTYTDDTNSFIPHEPIHVKVEPIDTNSFQVDNTDDYINDDVNHSESEIFFEEPNIIEIDPDIDDTIAVNANAIDDNDDYKMLQQNIDDLTMENDGSHLDTEITNSSNIKKEKLTPPVTPKQKLPKRIRTSTKKTETKEEFDPNFWLIMNFSEKEALEEFAARAQDSRYFTAKYKCNKCMKGFSREYMLKRHNNLRHNENNPFVCRFCKMTFKLNCKLTTHMPEHYKKYKCLLCNIVFGKHSVALRHGDLHSGVIWKCEYCGKEFRHLNTYTGHRRLVHRSEHVCTLCGASFMSEYGVMFHRKVTHCFEETEAVAGDGEYCSRCDVRFETRAAYDEHFAHSAKHDDKKSEENSSMLLKAKKSTLLNSSRRDFTKSFDVDCHICGKHFHSRSSYLKHHQAEHPGTALFAPHQCLVCEICGKSVYPNKMKGHVMAHGDSRAPAPAPVPVPCPVCHKKYTNAWNMRNHYRTHHETDPAKKLEISKNFTCDVCGVVISLKSNLSRHMRIHTGEMPHQCELCGRRFRASSSKKLHYRTVHLKEPHPKRKPRPKGVAKKNTVHQSGNEDDSDGSIYLYVV